MTFLPIRQEQELKISIFLYIHTIQELKISIFPYIHTYFENQAGIAGITGISKLLLFFFISFTKYTCENVSK